MKTTNAWDNQGVADYWNDVIKKLENEHRSKVERLTRERDDARSDRDSYEKDADRFRAALKDIATRFSENSKHFEWESQNKCECVVCTARNALRIKVKQS